MLNDCDRYLLERCRLAHLRDNVPELLQFTLHLDLEYVLHIHCSDSRGHSLLEAIQQRVIEETYFILGCEQLKAWFNEELIWQSSNYQRDDLESVESEIRQIIEETSMTAAVLERSTTAASSTRKASTSAKLSTFEDTVAAIAAITYQPSDTIGSLVLEAVPNSTWRYVKGQFLLPPNAVADTLTLLKTKIDSAIADMSYVLEAPALDESASEPMIEPSTNGAAAVASKPARSAKQTRKPTAKKTTARSTRSAKTARAKQSD